MIVSTVYSANRLNHLKIKEKMMKHKLMGCLTLLILLTGYSAAFGITIDVYSGHGTTGGGAPYSALVGSFDSTDVMFATNSGYAWHPYGLGDFGADITGNLSVGGTGTYFFSLNSDDGSLLYIDGALVVDNGGGHGPTIVTGSKLLTAGLHSFEIQFYEDFGGESGVDLYMPTGVTYASVPVPSAILFFGPGFAIIAALRRRFKS